VRDICEMAPQALRVVKEEEKASGRGRRSGAMACRHSNYRATIFSYHWPPRQRGSGPKHWQSQRSGKLGMHDATSFHTE
jgi:hypothetical protein